MDGAVLLVGSATAHDGWRLRGQPTALPHPVARRSGSGACAEACSEQDLAGMICWCPDGALLAQLPGTTLRAMFLERVWCP